MKIHYLVAGSWADGLFFSFDVEAGDERSISMDLKRQGAGEVSWAHACYALKTGHARFVLEPGEGLEAPHVPAPPAPPRKSRRSAADAEVLA